MSKVLVVDDDADILECLCMILQMHDFKVVCLSDCRDVLHIAKDEKPDLILLDINLSYCDGRQLCLELKNKYRFEKHILLFSANPELVPSISNYKADEFINKPFDLNRLVTTIREHMPDKQAS